MHSRNSSYRPSRTVPNWIPVALLAVSLVGFVDATYLTAKHYSGGGLECPIFEGCEQVTTSPYATLAGVPLALFGAIYYLAILLSVVAYLDIQRESILFLTARFTAIGFIASVWFVYLQVFVIQAICFYCMVSAATSTLLFLLGIMALRYRSIS